MFIISEPNPKITYGKITYCNLLFLISPKAKEDNSANIFSNDGSFMSQFKALLEKQNKEKQEKEQKAKEKELEKKKKDEAALKKEEHKNVEVNDNLNAKEQRRQSNDQGVR